MSIKAPEPFVPYWYTPKQDKAGEQTAFEVQGLTGIQYAELIGTARMNSKGVLLNFTSESYEIALRYGLKDWKNYSNSKGPVKFSKNKQTNMENMSFETIADVASEIIQASDQTEEEIKNS